MDFISINNLRNISETKKCQVISSNITVIKEKDKKGNVGKSNIIKAIEMYKKNQNMSINWYENINKKSLFRDFLFICI